MSGFSGRGKQSFLSSLLTSFAKKRRNLLRTLRMESLERRELMAADLALHHNSIIAEDVTRDYYVTPLDALTIINELNQVGGAKQLSSDFDRSSGAALMDVNADNFLTPLDALMVINNLNSGEGAGSEVVKFDYEFLSINGTSLDPNLNDNIKEYQVGVGQKFILRTLVQDLRFEPQTVASAYLDIEYRNQDNSSSEIAEVQWGEFNFLDIGSNANGGTFSLKYGTGPSAEVTAPISIAVTGTGAIDRDPTAERIAQAVGNLNIVGGRSNVRVESLRRVDTGDAAFRHFQISFINNRARQNLPNPTIDTNNLTGRDGNSPIIEIESQQTNTGVEIPADPLLSSTALLIATDFNAKRPNGTPQIPIYDNAIKGILQNPSVGTYALDEIGGTSFTFGAADEPGALYTVFDTLFVAGRTGTVLFSGNATEGVGTIVILAGEGAAVPADMILFPQNIPLRVVANITANDDTFPTPNGAAILEDSASITLPVTANDLLSVGTSFGITSVTQPSTGGSIAFTDGGQTVTFTPSSDFFGTTTFTYTITSNLGDASTATVTVTVAPVNDAPSVTLSSFDITEDPASPLALTPQQIFSPGPSNESGQTLTFVSVTPISGQTNGTATLNSGVVSYQPDANFFGTARFIVTVIDNGTTNGSAAPLQTSTTITVNVAAVNDAPIAFSGSIAAIEDTELVLIGAGAATDLLLSSQKGPDNESSQTLSLSTISATSTQGGTITTNGGRTVYQPAANFFGADTFTYTIADNGSPSLSATGTVTINVAAVNDGPDAIDDTGAARFPVIGLASVQESLNVLANDSPGANESAADSLRIVALGTPTRGATISIGPDGKSVLYSPKGDVFNVEETFTYTVEDNGGLRDIATAAVFIVPPKLPFALDDLLTVNEDSGATTIDVMSNDLVNTGATKQLVSFTQPARGTVTLDDRGTVSTSDDRLIFTPNAEVFQSDSFTYTITDTAPASEPAIGTVNVTIREINDAPSAVDRSAAGTEDQPLTITAATLLAGLSKGPLEDAQTLSLSSVSAVTPNAGTVSIVSGNVVYTPALDFNGTFLFLYTVQDNGTTNGASAPLTAQASVTVTVAPVNDAPVAGNDTATTAEDSALTIAIASILTNDNPGPSTAVDEQSPAQSVSFVPFIAGEITSSNGGLLKVSGTNLVYTPAADFNGQETFTYTIADNGSPSLQSTGILTIQVTEVNDPPLPGTINRIAYKNLNRVLDITTEIASTPRGPANESGQSLTLSRVVASPSTLGSVVLNADGTITYTPPLNGFVGQDSFTYELRDNGTTNGVLDPKSATGTIVIDVLPFIPSSIHGTVWVDDNADGFFGDRAHPERGDHELRLSGVSITLRGRTVGETQDIAPVTSITLADGSYRFDDLPPGVYTVSYVQQPLLIDGQDYPGLQGDRDSIENQFSFNIEAPGDIQARDYNFSVLGVTARYANIVENLASSFYGTHPDMRQKGLYGALDSNGKGLWTLSKDGFEDSIYNEVVLSDDGTKVYLTTINSNHEVFTSIVTRSRFVKARDEVGNTLIRILASHSDLTWTRVDLQSPAAQSARHYLESIAAIFAQEDFR